MKDSINCIQQRQKGRERWGNVKRSVETSLCDGTSVGVAEPGTGVEMSSQDLMNNISFALHNPVEKIIIDHISKVSSTNSVHAEGTRDSIISRVFDSEIAVKESFKRKKINCLY